MEKAGCLCRMMLLLLLVVGVFCEKIHQISRNDFPPDFVFGAAASAFQVEGAAAEDGRTPSIWDTFTHAGKMEDKSVADRTVDQYHKYKEDVKLMHEMGLDAYRFSISWSRLLPDGRGVVNPKGLEYYNNLIDELIKYGIEPHVTLHHFDLPQVLEDEYGGWLNERIVKDFTDYADICFKEFGDRVSYWSSLNEPDIVSLAAYDIGTFPPGLCSNIFGAINCKSGNSSTEPYIATHNQLLAHAAVARLYERKYKATQQGCVGITLSTVWYIPYTNTTEDIAATQRARDFMLGWYLHPLVFGDYPETMKKNVGTRLPSFSKSQSSLVKSAFNFIGANHYYVLYVSDNPENQRKGSRDFMDDISALFFAYHSSSTPWAILKDLPSELPINPWGLEGVLEYLKRNYGNPPLYIHENGYFLPYKLELNDNKRVNFLNAYLESLLKSVRNGSNTRGYFVWSLVDVWEFLFGYQATYGLYEVDFKDQELKRRPRYSARWYTEFLKKSQLKMEESNISSSVKESAI